MMFTLTDPRIEVCQLKQELINAIQSICCFTSTITPGWNCLRTKILFLSKQPVHPKTLMAVMMLDVLDFSALSRCIIHPCFRYVILNTLNLQYKALPQSRWEKRGRHGPPSLLRVAVLFSFCSSGEWEFLWFLWLNDSCRLWSGSRDECCQLL